jgi:replicative DNA helicase
MSEYASIQLDLEYGDLGIKYFPERDYRARDYKPFGEPKPGEEHFCMRCQHYYRRLAQKGITTDFCRSHNNNSSFLPNCVGDASQLLKDLTVDDFGGDIEAFHEALVVSDPAAWAEVEFGWKARWYQKEMLRCTSQFKGTRAGRRVGKTESMAVRALWSAWTNARFEVLIIAPYQPQVMKLFEMLRRFIGESVALSGSVQIDRESPFQQITFMNGSTIRGFSSGSKTGAKSDKVRGQTGDLIILDEVDYLADADIEVIAAILASEPETQIMGSSTPTGIRQKLWTWCIDKTQRFKEFWFVSSESPSWNKETEHFFKTMYSASGYMREFNAEFGQEMSGVFRPNDIEGCIKKYQYKDQIWRENCRYIIGVDWNNPVTGTHITVVEARQDAALGVKYKLVHKEVVRRAEFTQHMGVQRIMELTKKWNADYVYVDAGYGETQVEMLKKFDVDYPGEKTNFRKKVKSIAMNSNILIRDPGTGLEVKKPAKNFMVTTTARELEVGRIEISYVEDTQTRILDDEIGIADIGVLQQMRHFKVEKVSPTGLPRYSDGFEHTLTALMLAIMGFTLEFSDIRKIRHSSVTCERAGGLGVKSSPNSLQQMRAERASQRERLQPGDRSGSMGGDVKVHNDIERERELWGENNANAPDHPHTQEEAEKNAMKKKRTFQGSAVVRRAGRRARRAGRGGGRSTF